MAMVDGGADTILVQKLEQEIVSEVLVGIDANLKQSVHKAVRLAILRAVRSTPAKVTAAAARNGRPSPGGRCAAVWDVLDVAKEKGEIPSLSEVRKIAKRRRWNANNARIEYYQWRKHHGITRATV